MTASLSYDLGHISIVDSRHFTEEEVAQDQIDRRITEGFRLLYKQLSALDHETETKVTLPKPVIELPREKPIPVEKPKTRWEQFVKNKGLKIEKKETKVFDEATGEWKLRYGYKRGGKAPEEWLKEVPNGVMEDPFAKIDSEKKEKLSKQMKQERRNKARAARATAEATASVSTKASHKKELLRAAIKTASHPGSSASMNQFNKVPNKPAIFEEGAPVPKIFDRNKGKKKIVKQKKGKK
jgi:regulator of ribosome biosynthesis